MGETAQGASNITSLGLVFIVVMGFLTWLSSRRYALIPLLVTICYIPLGQQVVVAGLHFHFFRILLLVGVARVIIRREFDGFQLNSLDKLLLWWVLVSITLGTLSEPSSQLFINRLGAAYNAVGVYFLGRIWVRDLGDVVRVLQALAVMVVPIAISMIVEKFTSRNIFAIFGGVPEITFERDGKLRCQAAFRHPILAGTFGATVSPLLIGLWFQGGRDKNRAAIGLLSSAIITVAAASSGPLLSLACALGGFGLWGWRGRMHLVRWGAVLATIVLAVVMKAPVWYVIARISEIVGGTGWHRAYLIDQAISHFDEWWLVGTTSTAHWAPAGEVLLIDPMNMDITNQYVMEAVGGGVVKLGLFLAMIVKSFSIIGQAIRRLNGRDECCEKLIWAFGVSLWSHCVSFISIAYFDQLISLWYLSLAVIALFSLPTLRPDGLIGGQSRMRKESLSSGQINESSSARLSDWGKWAESKRRRKAADV